MTGGGTYTGGTTCTLTATANPGYTFSGWYAGSIRVSSNASYSFTVSSDRTITGKFVVSEPVIYVTLLNEHLDERDCLDIGYLTAPLDYAGEIPDYTINDDGVKTYAIYRPSGSLYPPVYIRANSYSDNKFLGWYDQDKNLYSTDPELSDREMEENFNAGNHIYAAFTARPNTSDESYTINVYARTWDGSWDANVKGSVGFDSNYSKTTIVAKHGTSVTIYAEGEQGNYDSDYGTAAWWYYIKGFYTSSHSPLQVFNDVEKLTAQYTFKATSNKDIYVEFVYYRR